MWSIKVSAATDLNFCLFLFSCFHKIDRIYSYCDQWFFLEMYVKYHNDFRELFMILFFRVFEFPRSQIRIKLYFGVGLWLWQYSDVRDYCVLVSLLNFPFSQSKDTILIAFPSEFWYCMSVKLPRRISLGIMNDKDKMILKLIFMMLVHGRHTK